VDPDVDDLYLYAQLVAESADEAVALVHAALREQERGHNADAGELITRIWHHHHASGRSMPEGAWLATREVPASLDSILPRLMARVPPSRRLAIARAFRGADTSESSEKELFLRAIQRALDAEKMTHIGRQITMEALEASMNRYLSSHLAPVPDTLRQAVRQVSEPSKKGRKDRLPLPARIAAGVLVILLSAAIGSWITSEPGPSSTPRSELFDGLAGLTVQEAEFRSSDPEQVERYVADRLDQRLRIPRLEEGALEGVSTVELRSSLKLPVVHYEDRTGGDRVSVFVMDYRFLERARNAFMIDERILNQIAEESAIDIRNAPDYYRVAWRYRDDIYVAITSTVDSSLRERFLFD